MAEPESTTARSDFAKALAGWLGCALMAAAVLASPVGNRAEGALRDLQMRALRAVRPVGVARDVVVVGLDEADLRSIPEPLGLMHRQLGEFIAAAADGGATAVAIDLALPDRSFDALVPGLDRSLSAALLAARPRLPVVFARTLDDQGRLRPVERRLLALAGADGLGLALFPRDADGVVRRFDERLGVDGSSVPTFVGQVARRLGLPVRAGVIDYSRGAEFEYVPLRSVLAWHREGKTAQLRASFANRPVLLGAVLPIEDRVAQPLDLAAWERNGGRAPGVLVHAQALRGLLAGGLPQSAPTWASGLLIALGAAAWAARWRPWALLTLAVFATAASLVAGAALLRAGLALPPLALPIAVWTAVAARLATTTIARMRERALLKRAFGASVSPSVMEEILAGRLSPRLGGERKELCILFSDIRGFTTRSESMPPEQAIALLNRYFERMVAAVHAEHGAVTNFMGDGIMAIFGAPRTLANPCAAAFACARAMDRELQAFNQELEREGLAPLDIGIGLHAGPAVVGNLGALSRNDYTAIGDAPNVASRVEGLTKALGYRVVCTEPVATALQGSVGWVPLGIHPIKGHSAVAVFGWSKLETAGHPGAGHHAVS